MSIEEAVDHSDGEHHGADLRVLKGAEKGMSNIGWHMKEVNMILRPEKKKEPKKKRNSKVLPAGECPGPIGLGD